MRAGQHDGFDEDSWQFERNLLDLPAGRLFNSGSSVVWLSEERLPDASDLWLRLSKAQDGAGMFPFLASGHEDIRLTPPTARAERVDVDVLFATYWDAYLRFLQRSGLDKPHRDDLSGDAVPPLEDPGPPYETWPGIASPTKPHADPEERARAGVFRLAPLFQQSPYVGLVDAPRSADIPGLLGWQHAGGHIPLNELCGVLRSWEDRFGARLLGFEGATLHLSVASPPTSLEHSTRVALEHMLFCPDSVYLSSARIFPAYAESVRGARLWTFRWE